jgi:hypothetical protein
MRFLILLFTAAFIAPAADNALTPAADNALTPAEKKAGFRLLFDGRTMNGWRDPAAETPPGDSWLIEDGCLRTRPKPRIREDLITRDSFADFELRFDWRISPRGNTGVKYRIQRAVFLDDTKVSRGEGGFEAMLGRELANPLSDRARMAPGATGQEYTIAYEFQLIDDGAYPGLMQRDMLHATGALYSMLPPTAKAARPCGEWNQSRIVLKGAHVEHWINGVKVLDGPVNSEPARAGISKRWAAAPAIRDMLLNAKPGGPLSLQHHGAAVWFKNLKLRPL